MHLPHSATSIQTAIQVLKDVDENMTCEIFRDLSYADAKLIYSCVSKQKSNRWIEHWIAKRASGNVIVGHDTKGDLGDIFIGDTCRPGINNIEIKATFEQRRVGGGQLRLYEPMAYYLFFNAVGAEYMAFLLTKNELVKEMRDRASTFRDEAGTKQYSLFTSSQGSNKITGSNEDREIILTENLENKRQDQISWGFNIDTEIDRFLHFQETYMVKLEDLKEHIHGKV